MEFCWACFTVMCGTMILDRLAHEELFPSLVSKAELP